MKKTISAFLYLLFASIHAQVGIGTNNPDPSAILELNADDKGFKGPQINLTGTKDQTTIVDPQKGLLVFNTANSGTNPNNVVANEYYYWNGTDWVNIASQKQIEEVLTPSIYTFSESSSQTFPNINNALVYQEINFSSTTPIVDKGKIVTKTGNFFTINKNGIYEVSANVYYTPAKDVATNVLSLLNIAVQRKKSGTTTWEDVATARRAWGNNTTTLFQTVFVPSTCIILEAGDQLRLAIANPYDVGNLRHGANARIGTNSVIPYSKSISIHLLDY